MLSHTLSKMGCATIVVLRGRLLSQLLVYDYLTIEQFANITNGKRTSLNQKMVAIERPSSF